VASPTTITTDGFTFTLEPASPASSPRSTTSPSVTGIVIGSNTFTIGSSSSTIIIGSETIVLGPTGIQVGSVTIPLPTGSVGTVITTDGITLSLPPEPASTTLSGVSSTTSSITDIVIGSNTFMIGSSTSTVIIGSETIVLGPTGIQVGSVTIPFPTGSIGTVITTDGITLSLPPEPASTALSGLSSTAGSITDIVIGSTTIPVGTISSTLTIGSETIVVGPSGIQIGTGTLSLPINGSATVVTTDGLTVTIGPGSNPTSVSITSTSFLSVPQSTASSSGAVITLPPGEITLGDQSSTESGSFTTITESISITGYSSSVTVIDGHTTIIPVWPCLFPPIPLCAIIIVPLVLFPPGGRIPPPPCQPAITFGTNLLPTPIFTGSLCIPTFTSTQTSTLSSNGGGVSILQMTFDGKFVGNSDAISIVTRSIPSSTIKPTSTGKSTSTKPVPPVTTTQAPPITFQPTATATCQPIGLRNVQVNGGIKIPKGDNEIVIRLPFTDVISGTWTVTFSDGITKDPKSLITFFRVDTGSGSFPFASDIGGESMTIKWSNPTGRSKSCLFL
jgi:hypothetical protein